MPSDLCTDDRDCAIRTMIGEAASDGDAGMTGVGSVILNRLHSGDPDFPNSIPGIIFQRNAFQAWTDRKAELKGYSKNSDLYQRAAQIFDGLQSGDVADPTNGATHYYSPSGQIKNVQQGRGPSVPGFAKTPMTAAIGHHQFYAPKGAIVPDFLGSMQAQPPAQQSGAPSAEPPIEDFLQTMTPRDSVKEAAAPAPMTGTVPVAPSTMSPAWIAASMPANKAVGYGASAARFGLGGLRGLADVGDTIAEGIANAGSWGTNRLAGMGVVSPDTAQSVGSFAQRVSGGANEDMAAYDRAAAGSPAAMVGRLGGQLLGTAPALEAGAALIPSAIKGALAARPLLATIPVGAAAGGATSAMTSATSDQSVPEQVATGMATGAALGPAGYAASKVGGGLSRLLLGRVDPETAALAGAARDAGIPVTAGQITANPLMRFADSVMQRLPFSGYGARTAEQQSGLNRGVAATFGEDADKITMQTVKNAKDRIGQAFEDVADRTGPIAADAPFYQRLGGILTDARSVLPASEISPLENQMRNVLGTIDPQTRTISPESYQALTRKDAPLSRAQQDKSSNVRFYANQMRDALDDVMRRSAPPDAVQDLIEARSQWKALKTIEPLAKKSTTGDINPALLLGAVNKSYAGAGGDLGNLARIGQRFIKEPPSSGTSERLLAMGAGKALIGGGLGLGGEYYFDPEHFQRDAALTGLALGLGRGVLSPALRSNWLANAMLGRSSGQKAADLFSRAAPLGALLARPDNVPATTSQ